MLNIYRDQFECSQESNADSLQKELDNYFIQTYEEGIIQLQKIKTILEGWEEIKKYIKIDEAQDGITEDGYYEYIEVDINPSENDKAYDSINIIKKALEVGNEKS